MGIAGLYMWGIVAGLSVGRGDVVVWWSVTPWMGERGARNKLFAISASRLYAAGIVSRFVCKFAICGGAGGIRE